MTLTAVGMPPGLTLNGSTGTITGSPTRPGNYPVTFYASDSVGDTGSAMYPLSVALLPFKIAPAALPSAQVGAVYQQSLSGSGGSQTGYTWSILGSLPPGLQQSVTTGCTECELEIAGTPTTSGSYPIAVTLTDSLADSVSEQITLIAASGTPPQIPAAVLPLATIGTSFNYSFVANGGTPPYKWSFSGNGPDPGLQLAPNGTLSGTPTLASACPSGPSSTWSGADTPILCNDRTS